MITQSEVPWEAIERDCILMSPDGGTKFIYRRWYALSLVCHYE